MHNVSGIIQHSEVFAEATKLKCKSIWALKTERDLLVYLTKDITFHAERRKQLTVMCLLLKTVSSPTDGSNQF